MGDGSDAPKCTVPVCSNLLPTYCIYSNPFVSRSSSVWELSADQLREWEECLDLAINQALDCGVEVTTVLNRIASRMHADVSYPASIVRVADILLTRIDDTCQLPTDLLDMVNDVLLRSYPPSPREVVKSIWILRTLTNLVSACEDSAETLFRNIWQGVSVWIADECKAVGDEYVPEASSHSRIVVESSRFKLIFFCSLAGCCWAFASRRRYRGYRRRALSPGG